MEQTHCVIKAGGLQETVRKKENTLLLRKKKVFYQQEQWVAFCVHNEKIPLLEWYDSCENNESHVPRKVHDLLYCAFINPVFGDDRGFIVGFSDEKNSALEFCAPDAESCTDWITTLADKLRELNCLGDSENVYAHFTRLHTLSMNSPSEQLYQSLTFTENSQPRELVAPIASLAPSVLIPPRSAPSIDTIPQSPPLSPPPLPPRPSNTLTRTRTLLTDEIPMQSANLNVRHNKTISNEYVTDFSVHKDWTKSTSTSVTDEHGLSESVKEKVSPTRGSVNVTTPLRQLSCCASLSFLMPTEYDSASNAPLRISSPLRVISKKIQYQHQQLQLSMDHQLSSADEKEPIPPLPPRKSLEELTSSMNNDVANSLERSPLNAASHRDDIYDTGKTNTGEQYDCLSDCSLVNYNILSVTPGRIDLGELDAVHVAVSSSSELTSSSSRTYSEEASSSSCKMRMSGLSSPVYSSRTSTSSESRRSAPFADATEYDTTTSTAVLLSRVKPREQYDFPTSPPLTIPTTYSAMFREALSKPRTISLLLTTCVEHIAFVEVGGKIWIAGWTQQKDTLFKKHMLNFGDELVQVGEELIQRMDQLPMVFYNQSTPGVPIGIKVRSIPHGSVFSLTKSVNPKRSLGIVLHNKKNRIASIEEKSPAWNAQVPAKIQPFVYTAGGVKETPAVITQVDGVPLNLFAKDEQFFHRVESIPLGSSFNVIIHPLDMVKLIKTQLKSNKFYKKFLHVD